jgi:hypothetical protein
VEVQAPGVRLSVPRTARPFLQQLARRRRFQADEARRWSGARERLSWVDVREGLAVLLSRGLIRRAKR